MKQRALLSSVLWLALASASAQTLVVGLYDYADLSANQVERLTETAYRLLAHSGIQVIWQNCRGTPALTATSTCETQMQVNEIVVRILPGGPPSSDEYRTRHLGRSIVTPEGGNYASVFVRAVRAQAGDFGVAFDLLLGYAVAHEIGHCLLGPGHSYAGLMRARWNPKDAGEISRLSLHLTKQESRKAVARLVLAAPAARR
jgi:hypothetical protein